MNERRRLAYLTAMGVQPLVPRLRLPGARPSPRCEITPLSAPQAHPPAAEPVRKTRVPPVAAKPAPVPRQASPLQRAPRSAAERFILTVGLIPGQLLLLDDGAGGGADYQQLLANFSRALLSGAECALRREVFRWPMVDNPAVDQGRDAARQALQALVASQAEKQQLRALVLMGDIAAGLLLPSASATGTLIRDDALPLPALLTDSGSNMLREPARKRQVWQDVQPLLQLLSQ